MIDNFDALDYVKKSKELGVPEQIAEYQARQFEESIRIAVNTAQHNIDSENLVTKSDLKIEVEKLRTEISQASNKIILWVAGLMVASGLIQHFFK